MKREREKKRRTNERFRCQILMTIDVWWLVHIKAINLIGANRSAIVSLIYPRCPNSKHSMFLKTIDVKWISSCIWFVWYWISVIDLFDRVFIVRLWFQFGIFLLGSKSCYYYFNCFKANMCAQQHRYMLHLPFSNCALSLERRAKLYSANLQLYYLLWNKCLI